MSARRPVIGVLCCNAFVDRPVQVVASRFVEPLSTLADATVLLVPALADVADTAGLSTVLDGLLLTGSRSHVAPHRYGADGPGDAPDEERDEVALRLSARMIEAGRPVFGICRGLQELNVLFGGTLSRERCAGRHLAGAGPGAAPGSWEGRFESLFELTHDVRLTDGGVLAGATGRRALTVNSVHEQGIDRLGRGLSVEAVASDDGLVEAIAARPCGAPVLAVQWHPEWDAARSAESRAFFRLIGQALREATGSADPVPPARPRAPGAPLRAH